MTGKPLDWNIVVVGAWNPAILTPDGIARRLFDLPPGTPLEVQVSLEGPAAIRVIHSDVMVIPSAQNLVVAPTKPTRTGLVNASAVARRAIESLPETPIKAVGVNIRYGFDPIPDRLLETLASTVDDRLAEANHRIVSKSLKRTVAWNQGLLNIEILEGEDSSSSLKLNYHRESADGGEVRHWLSQVDAMLATAKELALSTLKVPLVEEASNE